MNGNMEKYEIIQDGSFIKNRYYPGKLLHAADFINEQEYGNRKLEFLNRKFQGSGIIEGLEIRIGPEGGLKLTAGSAIDPAGRIIVSPRDSKWKVRDIEGLEAEKESDFILGIRYAERPAESEQAILEEDKPVCQVARIAETFALRAYSEEDWQRLWAPGRTGESVFVQEKMLYDGEDVKLVLKIPGLVPEDSVFRMRLQVRTKTRRKMRIRWQGAAKFEGAFFAGTGKSFQVLEKEWTGFTGELRQEWQICTEEGRKLPVELEFGRMEIGVEDSDKARALETDPCRLSIETAGEYRAAVRKYLWEDGEEDRRADWVPLGRLRVEKTGEEDEYRFYRQNDSRMRIYTARPGEEALLGRIAEENGIVDIRWRSLLKRLGRESGPFLPEPLPPKFPPPVSPKPGIVPERLKELVRESRREGIRQGVTTIPVPDRYRRGQVLYSEEISHGFPGEEVLIWWGVRYEGCHFMYGNCGRVPYSVVCGAQELFSQKWDAGWESRWNGNRDIREQALRQNVEKGTFQIALTLSKSFRRSRGREVTVSWIAIRIV